VAEGDSIRCVSYLGVVGQNFSSFSASLLATKGFSTTTLTKRKVIMSKQPCGYSDQDWMQSVWQQLRVLRQNNRTEVT